MLAQGKDDNAGVHEKPLQDACAFDGGGLLEDIGAGRKADGKTPYPEYIVVNTDELYAHEVIDILKRHGAWGEAALEEERSEEQR